MTKRKKAPNREPVASGGKKWKAYLRGNYDLYLMLLPALLFFFVFKYVPIYGLTLAFKDYKFNLGILGSPWTGLSVFREVFRERMFWLAMRNTLGLNLLSLLIGFPMPVIFALLLNELKNNRFKRVAQSISYLPHFVSWVIFYGIILALTAPETGLFNVMLKNMGQPQANFLTEKSSWLSIWVISSIWKETGWQAIMYLSALSGIDQGLYEAAAIDGAGRFKSMIHITLPGIRSTIVIILILQIGKIMTMGFEKPYLLDNGMVNDISQVLSTYIYTLGIKRAQYSFTTAVGLFQNIINFVLLLGADRVAKLLGETGLFAGGDGKK